MKSKSISISVLFVVALLQKSEILKLPLKVMVYKHNFVEADMNNPIQIRKYIEGILQTCRLAVLATEAHGQPHASLIAITPVQGFRQIIFATYRNTRKFENILHNGRFAVLIQGEDLDSSNPQKGFALTAFGNTQELPVGYKYFHSTWWLNTCYKFLFPG